MPIIYLGCLCLYCVVKVLYIYLGISPLLCIRCTYISISSVYFFSFLNGFMLKEKFYILMESNLSIFFFFVDHAALKIILKIISSSQRFFSYVWSRELYIFYIAFTLYCIDFAYGMRQRSKFIFWTTNGYPIVQAPFVYKNISPIELSWLLCQKQSTINTRIYFWILSLVLFY